MSSILEALKKLENEASAKSDIGSSLHQFYTKKSIQKRVQSDRLSTKRLLIIFTTLTLMVGSGLILTFEPWKKQPIPTTITDLNSELTPIIPAETKTTAPPLKRETTLSIKNSEKFDPPINAVKEPSLSAQKLKKEASDLFVKTETNPTEMDGIFEKRPASLQPIKKGPLTNGNEQASEQKKDNARFTSIPIKQASESMLELQAIAWSSHPEKRMAVINGHIVHEGGFVERTTVKHIGKNEVVFMKGGKEWRQRFRPTSNF